MADPRDWPRPLAAASISIATVPTMIEELRRRLEDLLNRATGPEERRDMIAQMKETLVQARVGLSDLRTGLETTRMRVHAEEKEKILWRNCEALLGL